MKRSQIITSAHTDGQHLHHPAFARDRRERRQRMMVDIGGSIILNVALILNSTLGILLGLIILALLGLMVLGMLTAQPVDSERLVRRIAKMGLCRLKPRFDDPELGQQLPALIGY